MTLTGVEEEITEATEKLSLSVVNIEAWGYVSGGRFGGYTPGKGAGSGIIIDPIGHVITNNHVVDSVDYVRIGLYDGRIYKGKVVGADEGTDIAVVDVMGTNGETFPFASLGDSEQIKVGHIALAIGNSLGLPGGPTVSLGVISALGRPLPGADFIYEGFIQTDAAINPGNSGGPLANLRGEVIGINTAIIPNASGIGFAIPINLAKQTAMQIIEYGRVIRPWIGISAIDVEPPVARHYDLAVQKGIMVIGISRFSPAVEAGLRIGDVIVGMNGHNIAKLKDLFSELARTQIGSAVRLLVVRSKLEREFSLRLVEMPARLAGGRIRRS